MECQELPLTVEERKKILDERWKPLPQMKKGSDRGMFGDGVAAHRTPLVTRVPNTVLPGVQSTDPAFLNFLSKLTDGLNEACPKDLDEKGFTRSGVFQTFDTLKTVSGWMMNPMSYVAVDNRRYIEHLGLRTELNPVEIAIGEELWHLTWSQYVFSKLKVAKLSQGGPRRNTHDHEWKKAFGEWILQPQILEQILDLHAKKDYLGLANLFEMLFIMYSQKRNQPDVPGKPREVMDLEYARSGGERGHISNADKEVWIDGMFYEFFSCTRARFIHAGPWVINVILSMMSTGTMQALFMNFPNVFHVNTKEHIKSIVDGNYVYAGDVKEYDRSMREATIKLLHRVAKEYWDERLVDVSEHLYFSAYFSRPLNLDGSPNDATIIGDYTSFDPQVICGNRSGHAWTSLVAKVNKVWETLYVFHLCGIKVLGNIKNILLGRAEIGLVNNGDDEIIHTKSSSLMDKFEKVREDKSAGGYVVTREDGAVYSGWVLRLVDEEKLEYDPCPRLLTGFTKIYVPERSIGGLMRPYWHIGVAQRINERSAHPAAEVAWEVHDKLYHDLMKPRFGGIYEMLTQRTREIANVEAQLTEADKEVLDDPSKLYYKYVEGDIHPEVVALSTIHIPCEAFSQTVKAYYRGNVTERNAVNDSFYRRTA